MDAGLKELEELTLDIGKELKALKENRVQEERSSFQNVFADEYFDRANRFIEEKEWEKAIEEITKFIGIEPHYADAYIKRSEYYNSYVYQEILPGHGHAEQVNELIDHSINDAKKAVELNPIFENYKILLEYYIKAVSGNKYSYKEISDKYSSECINFCNDMLNKKIFTDYAWYCHSKIFGILSNYDKALEYCNNAININPKGWGYYAQRGYIYHFKGDYQNSERDLQTEIEKDGDIFNAYEYMHRFNKKDRNKQIDIIKRAVIGCKNIEEKKYFVNNAYYEMGYRENMMDYLHNNYNSNHYCEDIDFFYEHIDLMRGYNYSRLIRGKVSKIENSEITNKELEMKKLIEKHIDLLKQDYLSENKNDKYSLGNICELMWLSHEKSIFSNEDINNHIDFFKQEYLSKSNNDKGLLGTIGALVRMSFERNICSEENIDFLEEHEGHSVQFLTDYYTSLNDNERLKNFLRREVEKLKKSFNDDMNDIFDLVQKLRELGCENITDIEFIEHNLGHLDFDFIDYGTEYSQFKALNFIKDYYISLNDDDLLKNFVKRSIKYLKKAILSENKNNESSAILEYWINTDLVLNEVSIDDIIFFIGNGNDHHHSYRDFIEKIILTNKWEYHHAIEFLKSPKCSKRFAETLTQILPECIAELSGLDEAIRLSEEYIDFTLNISKTYYILIPMLECILFKNEYKKAIEYFDRNISYIDKYDKHSIGDIYLKIIDCAFSKNDIDEANDFFEKYINSFSRSDVDSLCDSMLEKLILLENEDKGRAFNFYKKYPNKRYSKENSIRLINYLISINDYVNAAKICLDLHEAKREQVSKIVEGLIAQEAFDEALILINHEGRYWSEGEDYTNKIVTIIVESGDYDRAVEIIDKYFEHDYKKQEQIAPIIEAMISQGDYDRAIELIDKYYDDYKKRKQIAPIIEAMISQGDYDRAIELIDKYFEHDFQKQDPIIPVIKAIASEGNYDRAIELIDKYFEHDFQKQKPIVPVIETMISRKDYDKAFELAKKYFNSSWDKEKQIIPIIEENISKGDYNSASENILQHIETIYDRKKHKSQCQELHYLNKKKLEELFSQKEYNRAYELIEEFTTDKKYEDIAQDDRESYHKEMCEYMVSQNDIDNLAEIIINFQFYVDSKYSNQIIEYEVSQGQYDKVIALLNKFFKDDFDKKKFIPSVLDVMISQCNYDKAIELIDKCFGNEEYGKYIKREQIKPVIAAIINQGDYEKAIELIEKYLEPYDQRECLYKIIDFLLNNCDYEDTLVYFNKNTNTDEQKRNNAVCVLSHMISNEKWSEAFRFFKKHINSIVGARNCVYNLLKYLIEEEKNKEALKFFKEYCFNELRKPFDKEQRITFLEYSKGSSEFVIRSLISENDGELNEAINYLKEAITLSEDDRKTANCYLRCGILHEKLNEHDKANEQFQKVKEYDPKMWKFVESLESAYPKSSNQNNWIEAVEKYAKFFDV